VISACARLGIAVSPAESRIAAIRGWCCGFMMLSSLSSASLYSLAKTGGKSH
jgi:hypothetical protein